MAGQQGAPDCRLESATYVYLETAFQSLKEELLTAVSVTKTNRTTAHVKRKPASRVLCITRPTSEAPDRLKLHTMKQKGSHYEIQRTYKIRNLKALRKEARSWVMEFHKSPTLVVEDVEGLDIFLNNLENISEKHCGVKLEKGGSQPLVQSTRPVIEAETNAYFDDFVLEGIEDLHLRSTCEGQVEEKSLLSPQEEEAVTTLLNTFGVEISELAEVLQREVQALERSNVKSVIETEGAYSTLQSQLYDASVQLGDFENQLRKSDLLLTQLKTDIEAINTSNSQMDLAKKNYLQLNTAIGTLSEKVVVGDSHVYNLTRGSFDTELQSILESVNVVEELLHVTVQDEEELAMKSVQERLRFYTKHRQTFLSRFASYLEDKMQASSIQLLASRSRLSDRKSLVWKTHGAVFDALQPLSAIMTVMKANELPSHIKVRRLYAVGMQSVYKKEISAYFHYARKFVQIMDGRRSAFLLGSADHSKNLDVLVQSQSGLHPQSARVSVVSGRSSVTWGASPTISEVGSSGSEASSHAEPYLAVYKGALGGGSDGSTHLDSDGPDKLRPDRAFANFLFNTVEVVVAEQNFISTFFDLADTGEQAGEIVTLMNEIFSWKTHLATKFTDLQGYVEWYVEWLRQKCDKFYLLPCLSVLRLIQQEHGSQSTFLAKILEAVGVQLIAISKEFVKEQVSSMEKCKVDIKHTFVVPYFTKFPVVFARIQRLLQELMHVELDDINAMCGELVDAMFACLDKHAEGEEKYRAFFKFKNYAYIVHKSSSLTSNVALLTRGSKGSSAGSGASEPSSAHSGSGETSAVLSPHNPSTKQSFRARQSHIDRQKTTALIQKLSQCMKIAERNRDENELEYIKSVCSSSFEKLFAFISGVETLLKAYEPREVTFQAQYSKQVTASLVESLTKKALREGSIEMAKRVKKHFTKHVSSIEQKLAKHQAEALEVPGSPTYLAGAKEEDFRTSLYGTTFGKIKDYFGNQYERFHNILLEIYPRLQLQVPPSEVSAMLEMLTQTGGGLE